MSRVKEPWVKSLADESEADDVFCGKQLGGGYLKQFW